jgi:hypothetical protein
MIPVRVVWPVYNLEQESRMFRLHKKGKSPK